jgi:hypothetical protein
VWKESNILEMSLLKMNEKGHITGGGDEWGGNAARKPLAAALSRFGFM